MTMQTDVKSGTAAAATSTTLTSYRSRVKAVALTYTSSAGAITIADGNGGTTLFTFTPAAVAGSLYMLFPGEGILAQNGIYVTNGTGTTATVLYG
jgi:hypothetical protein